MLVVSAGMQKSGSAYLYNIINDLLVVAGNADARGIKSKYKLDDIVQIADISGFRQVKFWKDKKSYFIDTLWRRT